MADHQGGHFYNAAYGVRVKGGNDTVVAWDPSHWHGTSLQDYEPTLQHISDFNQVGLAIVTPNRLGEAWKEFARNNMTLDDLVALAQKQNSEDECDEREGDDEESKKHDC